MQRKSDTLRSQLHTVALAIALCVRRTRRRMKTSSIQHDTRDTRSTERDDRDAGAEKLRSYRRRPTIKLRNELIELHRKNVESIARSLSQRLPRSVDVQDLVHAGIWGLMQAIESFDLNRGTPFLPFMRRRVRGAMLDELRNLDYLPRLYRRLARDRDDVAAVLRDRLSRDPSDAEIAAELGVSERRLRHVATSVQAGELGGSQDPFERGVSNGGFDLLADEGVENPLEALDRREILANIEASLEPIEWRVLEMHYFEGLAGKEIARQLRLSASRICQIHGRVLSRLKARLDSSN